MTRRDAGYATVTVTALMLGLSVLAIAWMEKSLTSSKSADRLSAQILSDIYVEGALNEALGTLINSRGLPEEALRNMTFRSGEQEARVTLSSMRNLVDLNSAPMDEIEHRLKTLNISPLEQRRILARLQDRSGPDADPLLSLEPLDDAADFSSLLPCLEEHFTVFHDPSPPTRRGESAKLGEGSLVRIIASAPTQHSALQATVLITGLNEEPYWVFDWKHTNEANHATC